MSHTIAAGDFVEVEFTGKLTENGEIVDTNNEAAAKKHGLYNEGKKYEPVTACIGAKQLLPGIDDGLVGKGMGTYTFTLPAEQAFGRKNPKLIQLISTQKFYQQQVNPQPGMPVEIDGMMGIIRTVAGGRTIVDFNHPLSGKDVTYEVTVKKIITEEKEKLEAVLSKHLGFTDFTLTLDEHVGKVQVKDTIHPQIAVALSQQIVRMIPSLRSISFEQKDSKNANAGEKSAATHEHKKKTDPPAQEGHAHTTSHKKAN